MYAKMFKFFRCERDFTLMNQALDQARQWSDLTDQIPNDIEWKKY